VLTIKRLDMRIGQSCIPLFFFAKNEWSPDFADRLRLQGEEGADEKDFAKIVGKIRFSK
tara:strand:+ start:774 stop:950 length:177 start_codon:yes stop_codon:yes gene_type:complete